MPLIDIWMKPEHKLKPDPRLGRIYKQTVVGFVVRRSLAPQLPNLFIKHCDELGLGPETTAAAVQVQPRNYDPDTVNGVTIWVKVQLTELPPHDETGRQAVAQLIWHILEEWFINNGFEAPDDLALDVFWGPASGCVRIDGNSTSY